MEYTTLEDAVYADLKNDLGFIINNRFIILTEHQHSLLSFLQSLSFRQARHIRTVLRDVRWYNVPTRRLTSSSAERA